jgi:hypothetical protein
MESTNPTACRQPFEVIFRFFEQSCISFEQSDFYGLAGSYHALLKELYAKTQEARPEDFGRLPFKATAEHNDEYKMRNTADPPLQPFTNPEDLVMSAMYKASRDLTLRDEEVCRVHLFGGRLNTTVVLTFLCFFLGRVRESG